jgi:septal ring factor EnvC (AmiA/AmiB activator)
LLGNWLPGLLLGSLTLVCLAAPEESDLQKIGQEISSTENRVAEQIQQQDTLSSELKHAEIALSQIKSEKNALLATISKQQNELKLLHQQEAELLKAKAEQEQRIYTQLNAAYQLGHDKNIKLLLNQKDTSALTRSMTYSDYLTRARVAALTQFQTTLDSIAANKEAIESANEELLANQNAMAEKEALVKQSYQERNATLSRLQASINNDKSRISQLKNNRAKLQNLLRDIRKQLETAQLAAQKEEAIKRQQAKELAKQQQAAAQDKPKLGTTQKTPPPPAAGTAFAQRKGRLHWPAPGKIAHHYGELRQPGNFRWEGIMLNATQGTAVQAVHNGKVVFAEWFRGKGLLLIIDHGNGYMSLYAHNETLNKKAGDVVEAGDIIATVGDSGGLSSPQLYFELRFKGEPINPENWLTNKG